MASIQMKSSGLEIGSCYLPPFQLHKGETITFLLPSQAGAAPDRILQCLVGKRKTPGLVLHASVLLATPANSLSRWLRWFKNPTSFDWLKKNTSLSNDQIRSILAKHGMDRDVTLDRLAGTPRTLLGLETVYARGAEVVIFSTLGLDPLGVQKVFQTVEAHLPVSAIYLSLPFCSQGKEGHNQLPGSLCITVTNNVPIVSL